MLGTDSSHNTVVFVFPGKADAAVARNARRYHVRMNNGNESKRKFHNFEKDANLKRNGSAIGEEHEHYGVFPLLDKAFNDTFGYGAVTDDLKSNVKNVIEDEANNKLSSHEQELLGIRRTVPGWNGVPSRRAFDNGNKDQNNNETDENDDYEYKIANQSGLLSSLSLSSESGDSVEINDRMAALGQRFNGESMQDKDAAEKKSTLGWLKRKLLSIEGDSVADDREDTEFDYKDDNMRVGVAGEFKHRGGSYRNEGDDDRDKLGDPAGDDYYDQSDDPKGDISDRGVSSNRYAADMGGTHTNWNKANHKRVDIRNDDKVTSFRRRKSAKPVGEEGGEMSPSSSTDKKKETIQDQSTVYRQQSDDSDQVETTTACDCAVKCATAETTTDERTTAESTTDENTTEESTQETETTEASDVDEEESTEEAEEEVEEEEVPTEEPEEPVEEPESNSKGDLGQKKEVYIDLRIGIKNVGNDSSSSQEEPVEFHKKIVVKREELEKNVSAQAVSSESHFPIDLVKAIYQLVDKDDSLRKHVAPRLPDRTKLLSKLEQPGRRQKINDHRLESTVADKSHARGGASVGVAPSVASFEDDKTNNKALASVFEAIGELIRKRS